MFPHAFVLNLFNGASGTVVIATDSFDGIVPVGFYAMELGYTATAAPEVGDNLRGPYLVNVGSMM